MQIFSKGSYQFGPGHKKDGSVEKFVTSPKAFQDMPEKFADDPLFKDCVKLGLVRIAGKPTVEEVETVINDNEVDPKQAELEEIYVNIKSMDIEQLVSTAEELGLSLTGDEKAKELRKIIYSARKKEIIGE